MGLGFQRLPCTILDPWLRSLQHVLAQERWLFSLPSAGGVPCLLTVSSVFLLKLGALTYREHGKTCKRLSVTRLSDPAARRRACGLGWHRYGAGRETQSLRFFPPRPNSFVIITANRVLHCNADTPEEMHHWITLLQRSKGDTRVEGQEFVVRGDCPWPPFSGTPVRTCVGSRSVFE